MTFTSFNFLIFFPVVVLLYNIMPGKWRLWFLLAASYFFYMNLQPVYALLLAAVTVCTYFTARWIGRTDSEKIKKRIMTGGIILVLLPLLFFKYFAFINNAVSDALVSWGLSLSLPRIELLLPVGISFYTFMAIGYIVDVYNEEVDYEKNIGAVGLFLSFFPLVLSGPIERAGNMFLQFKDMQASRYSDLVKGAKLMLWGYFMKLCVADRLGIYVDAVFNNIANHNGTTLAFASVLYPFQVYADLGGYSLTAIGVARCLGLEVIPNFKRPFFATSMSEFWRRWHMSLIQWLTDYIYTPLSFALRGWKIWGIVAALMLTFLISGLWHGAALTFIVWGVVQGIYLSLEALIQGPRTRSEIKYRLKGKWWYTLICCVVVFVLFAFSQIFGRCANLPEAFYAIGKIFTEPGTLFIDKTTLSHALPCLLLLLLIDFREEFFSGKIKLFENKLIVIRWLSYIIVIILILSFGVLDAGQFIYFQF